MIPHIKFCLQLGHKVFGSHWQNFQVILFLTFIVCSIPLNASGQNEREIPVQFMTIYITSMVGFEKYGIEDLKKNELHLNNRFNTCMRLVYARMQKKGLSHVINCKDTYADEEAYRSCIKHNSFEEIATWASSQLAMVENRIPWTETKTGRALSALKLGIKLGELGSPRVGKGKFEKILEAKMYFSLPIFVRIPCKW